MEGQKRRDRQPDEILYGDEFSSWGYFVNKEYINALTL